MAKKKYTYCKKCEREMEGIAKFCDQCGRSDSLIIREKDDGKNSLGLTAEKAEIYNRLPESLRGLYLRKENPTDLHARVEWIKLIHYDDPRIRFLGIDAVSAVPMYESLYREDNCGEAAYMLARCYLNGITRTSAFHRDVERNRKAAYHWYRKAAEAKYYPAYIELGRMKEEDDPHDPSSLNIASHYYGMAKQAGLKEGAVNYARLAAQGYKGILGNY